MIRKAVVLCGGLATRFLPFCKSVPKEMLPLVDKPVIQVIVEQLVEAGITDIFVIIGRNKECIVNHFDRNIELEDRLKDCNKLKELDAIKRTESLANITFRRQIIPRGTGHAVAMAKDWVADEPFLMCFGDETFVCPKDNVYKQLIDSYDPSRIVLATMQVEKKDIPLYGIVDRETNDTIHKIKYVVEKPSINKAPSDIAIAGPSVLDKRIFDYIDKCPEINYEVLLTDAYEMAMRDGILFGRTIDGFKLDLGNKAGFIKSNIFMALNNEDLRQDILDYINKIK